MDSYECEICGKKTKSPTVPTKVESAVFKVCPDCIKHGTPIETHRTPVVKTGTAGPSKAPYKAP
ncbi:MAG: hypothetical protein FWH46_03605, partial [Methanimicrococcus sp.]|nr:hypothetical protein [Methanimicrococcus sp.]